jgi:uncharacterized protein (TIGR03545 family)
MVVVYLLFANTLIKSMAQDALTEASGAEVNIGSVAHSLFPLGVNIDTIEFTDNMQPLRNKLEVGRVKADVAFMPLLSSKLIIENLLVDEVAFSTPRQSAGKVFRVPDAQSGFAFPTLEDLPSVDDVLKDSPLATTKAIEQSNQVYIKYKTPLEEKYATLPDEERIAAYKAKVQNIQKMDFNNPANIVKAKEMLEQVKADIQADQQVVSEFITLAQKAKGAVGASVVALKRAPAQDFDLLQGLVAGDEAAIGQVTQHLFGDKAQLYTRTLVAVADMLQNADTDAAVAPEQPDTTGLPNVWIKNAVVSVKWLDDIITSDWQNITDQHVLVGRPTTFNIDSTKTNYWDAVKLNGEFEILANKVNATQNWNIQGLKIENAVLIPESAKQKLNAVINSGLLAANGSLKINNNQLDGKTSFSMSQLDLDASGSNNLTKTIAAVISEQKSMALTGTFYGDIASPSVNIESQFDQGLIASLGAGLANNPQLAELKEKLNAKVTAQLGILDGQLDGINALLDTAQGDTAALTDLLNTQLSNKIDEKKDELLDKLKNKLFND